MKKSKKEWLPFKEARAIVRKMGLKSQKEWHAIKKPKGIPSNPNSVYKAEWKSYPDWIGTEWLPFKEAQAIVRKMGLKSMKEWNHCKKPKGIPSCPNSVYRAKWKSFPDWLGYSNKFQEWLPFKEARDIIRKIGIKNISEWKALKRPKGISSRPDITYKAEWKSYPDWFGNSNRIQEWLPFKKARTIIRKMGIKSMRGWQTIKKPKGIPSNPNSVYKAEWKSYPDWLGYPERYQEWLPFKKARDIARKMGLKSMGEWRDIKKPKDIPSRPEGVYTEWKSYPDWLGNVPQILKRIDRVLEGKEAHEKV